VKSQEYFQNFHCESFQTLRDMVEAESWHNFPIDLEERRGIIGIIQGVLLRDSSRLGMIYFEPSSGGSSLSSPSQRMDPTLSGGGGDAAVSASMLSRFATEGNPFHVAAATRDGEAQVDSSITSSSPGEGVGKGEGSIVGSAVSRPSSSSDNCFWSLLTRDDWSSAVSKRQHQQQQASMIVTQVALNGIAKYVAKYLLLMYLLPSTAPLIFEQLTDLFNYYVCAVFNGFMPIEEKQRFLAAPTKINASPPDQSKEYEVLRAYLETVLDSPVVTSASDYNNSSHYHSAAAAAAATDTSHDSYSYNDGIGNNTDSSEVETGDLPILNSQQQQQQQSIHRKSFSVTSPATATLPSSTPTPSRMGTKMVLLLRPPAVPLHLESSCMALNERIVAAESCYFIAKVVMMRMMLMVLFDDSDRLMMRC
jgi:hypothetical protein